MTELGNRLQRLAEELNGALIEDLVRNATLSSPAWRAAFQAVPRHRFAPRFTLPDNAGGRAFDAADSAHREEWLRAAYQSKALLTDLDEHNIATTSCSAPSVVATMLEASQAVEGDSVLEIGTGTGWTAGLLSHRLGSDAVTSVDVNPRCVTEARERLDALDLTPTLAACDGYQGYEPHAPYDRIIATASLRQVPPAWLGQVRPGGTILVDLRGNFAGNLALLTVEADQSAHGRFLPETVNFMPLRSEQQPFELLPELSSRAVNEPGNDRVTSLDPAVLRKRTFAFFAQVALPGNETGQVRVKGGPTYFCLTDPHSQAWARVELGDQAAARPVTQGGDRRLWDELEAAHEWWEQLDQPQPEDFTIFVSSQGEQVVRLAGAEGVWRLPL
ncbi:MAG TPA: methyltransferase domain-containing protein [Pseudonocardiaceae bacterium]|nr:methyltransferase domain-containing protein [Pseudonocardiaceae bacterium]